MATKIDIGGELNPRTVEGIVADASTIIDRTAEKRQDEINSEVSESLEGKQGVIADLETIRSGAASGSTAIQPTQIEDVVRHVDTGALEPLLDPSDYATTTQLNQLGQKVDDKLIKLTGMGANASAGKATQEGDVFYNTSTKLLRKRGPGNTYTTVPFLNGAVYTIDSTLYVWDGSDLVTVNDTENIVLRSEVFYKRTGIINSSGLSYFFNDIQLVSGRKYYIKWVGGTGGIFYTYGTNQVNLVKNTWVVFTAAYSMVPRVTSFPGGADIGPTEIIIADADGVYGQFLKELSEETDELLNDVFGTTTQKAISASSGTGILSATNLYNGEKIPVGSQLSFKIVRASGLISVFRIVDQAWSDLVNTSDFSDGDVITVTTTRDITSFGLYVTSTNVIGTGTVVIDVVKSYESIRSVYQEKTKVHTINVSRDGTTPSGKTIHFSGLNAIADAINSISDASRTNRYIIHIEGEFHFTDPMELTMYGGNEYSAIFMKDYVDLVGDGPDKTTIFVDFPANATFHDGKAYSDYQPIYMYGTGGNVSGIRFVGRNCRYAFHIENGPGAAGKEINIDNCVVEYLGHPDYTGSYGNGFGTGISNGQKWNIKNCVIRGVGYAAFAMHTPLSTFDTPPEVNFENCVFDGDISLHNYQVENNTFVNFLGCSFASGIGRINTPYYSGKSVERTANFTRILVKGNGLATIFDPYGFWTGRATQVLHGGALRIVSASTGDTSVVSFDKTASAFDIIVGNSSLDAKITTIYGWESQYGFVFRDGGIGISGQAFGTIDVAENSGYANASLGKRLGDCSGTSKVLNVSVDGVEKTITFNQDYTSMSNADILAEINTALGGDAIADIFSPAKLYYPNINGMKAVQCKVGTSILAGMGVVFVDGGMRRAKNTDGYIDGICLEDTAAGQYGRVITKGYIYTKRTETADYIHKQFVALDNYQYGYAEGISAGISATNDGEFDTNASPKFLRMMIADRSCWKII